MALPSMSMDLVTSVIIEMEQNNNQSKGVRSSVEKANLGPWEHLFRVCPLFGLVFVPVWCRPYRLLDQRLRQSLATNPPLTSTQQLSHNHPQWLIRVDYSKASLLSMHSCHGSRSVAPRRTSWLAILIRYPCSPQSSSAWQIPAQGVRLLSLL